MSEANGVIISQIESRYFLQVGKETVEVRSYNVSQSDDGKILLTVTIEGDARELVLSTNSAMQM